MIYLFYRLQLWLAHEISNQQRALNSKSNQNKTGSTLIRSAGFSHTAGAAGVAGVSGSLLSDTPTTIDEALYTQVCFVY